MPTGGKITFSTNDFVDPSVLELFLDFVSPLTFVGGVNIDERRTRAAASL